MHAGAGVAHAVGAPQSSEFSWGVATEIVGELPLSRVVSAELAFGLAVLSDGDPPRDPSFADRTTGILSSPTLGLRVQPGASGLWADLRGGVGITGPRVRPTFGANVGYDFRVDEASLWGVGPVVGYAHVFQSDDNVRPEDGRILWGGIHVVFGKRGATPPPPCADGDGDGICDAQDACPREAGVPTSNPETHGCPAIVDRDGDGILDPVDACPDVPGIATDDPKTNGCPRPDRDADGVFDDEDACPEVAGIRTDDPKTNGCPKPSDRDEDGVVDAEDACPDVPGIATEDPKTNGCPPALNNVRLQGDRIVLDDIIHFDLDSPRVKRASWPLVKKVAEFINATPDILEVLVEGHADESGTPEHNLVLSGERSESIRALLVKFGVDTKRITTRSYGDTQPRVQAGHGRVEAANRRVEFIVVRARKEGSQP